MKTDTPQTIYLKDYTPYPYDVEHIDLNFDIHDGYTIVTAKTRFVQKQEADLYLHGEDLELMSFKIDGEDVSDFDKDDKGMTLPCPGKHEFELEIVTRIKPEDNTRLEGLYKSGDTYCTQCEAEGFRRITYYPDRPDVLTKYTVRLEASKDKYPVLLSNGNRIDHGDAEHKRHFAVWHDPWPKPCYLFALVAGNLTYIEDEFTTKSGRKVELYIYVRPGDEEQCAWAMEALKKSMKWEEDVYGLEYDLDLFNIVAVSDFNMGAMENKSLNIFNTALVLAHQDTATDQDFMRVESVIAHEYFHNWSGNRVTCRDWFQLSLKEGLTVFRDQEFSADLHSRDVQRIDDVQHLRRFQFPEDAGPLAHPIRPDNYIEINNFYTMTVYEKGAEVIRMIRTLLGPEDYRKATDLYFSRFDGQAVTCDDWLDVMEEASGQNLSQFRLWYEQAGTPKVHVRGIYHEAEQTCTLEMEQIQPETPGQNDKKPMHIPVRVGLLYPPPTQPSPRRGEGNEASSESELAAMGGGEDIVLHLTEAKQSFVIENVPEKPVPSVLRGFSAPVKLDIELSDDELAFLMVHDSDGFNRWEAGQTLALRVLNNVIPTNAEGSSKEVKRKDPSAALGMTIEDYLNTYGQLLDRALEPDSDKALMARMIALPDVATIGQGHDVVDPQAIYEARESLLNAIVDKHADKLEDIYQANRTGEEFAISAQAMGKRALQNTAMLIAANKRTRHDALRAEEHYDAANNMTDRMAALHLACALDGDVHEAIVGDFYARFKSHELVVNKWFSAQAMVVRDDSIQIIKKLQQHNDFTMKNPNRVRALYAAFAMNNPVVFHQANGAGYDILRDAIIKLNSLNPQIAARLLTPFKEWRRYTADRQEKMQDALETILAEKDLSPDVYEIASKSLSP